MRILTFLFICIIHNLVFAQHRTMPHEDYSKKTKKELFEIYQTLNTKIVNEPNNAKTHFERGWLRYYLRDTVNAISDLKISAELNPQNPFYQYGYAYVIIDKGEYDAVIVACNEALKYDKTFVDVLVMRGDALDHLAKYNEARENYVEALRIDSSYEDIYLQYAASYTRTNNLKEADELVDRLLKKYPNSEDGLNCKMFLLMLQKKYTEAIATADKLIKNKKKLTSAYLVQAAAYDSLKNQNKICECMTNLMLLGYIDGYEYIRKKCPKEQNNKLVKVQTYQMQAVAAENRADYEESMRLFNEVIKLQPDSGSAYYNRGKLKRRMEDHAGAIEDYMIAIKKSPGFLLAYVGAGVSYTFMGDITNAKKYYLKSMQVDPTNEMAYYNFADILTKNENNCKEAIYYYKFAIDLKPDYVKAWYWLGDAYGNLNMNSEACEAFKMAEQLGEVKAISKRLWYCK